MTTAKAAKIAKPKPAKAKKTSEPDFYSKNAEFLGQAFSLFCKGMSLPSVAAALEPEWPCVNLRSLQRSAKQNGWEAARASFLALHTQASASAEGLVPEIVMQLQRVRMTMEARGLIEVKDIYAYRQLAEDLMWYTGKHPKLKDQSPLAISGDAEIGALLEAIAEDEIVSGAWKRRRSHIERAYRDKVDALATVKADGKVDGKPGNSTQRHEGRKKSKSKKSAVAK